MKLGKTFWIGLVILLAIGAGLVAQMVETRQANEPKPPETMAPADPSPEQEQAQEASDVTREIHDEMSYSDIPEHYLNEATFNNICYTMYETDTSYDMTVNQLHNELVDAGYYDADQSQYEHLVTLVDFSWCRGVQGY